MAHSGLVVNEGTQSAVAVDTVGTLDYGVVKLDVGATGVSSPFTGTLLETTTVSTVAAVGQIHNAGTVAALPDLPGGTVDLVTTVTTVGTVTGMGTLASVGVIHNAGTIAALPDLPGGTVDLVTLLSTVTTVGTTTGMGTLAAVGQVHNAGTIAALPDLPGGTVDQITSVSNLVKGTVTRVEGGSIVVTAGTVVTTIGDLTGGTIDLITALTTVSTVAAIGQVHNAGTIAGLPDLPGGTVDLITAVASVSNLVKGTITKVEGGTLGEVTLVPTVTIVGTVTGAGTLAAVGVVHNAGTIAALPDLPGGTVDLVTAVTTVTNLTNGSVAVTAGTISAITADLPGGTVDEVTSVANVAGGTVQINPKPSKAIITYGTTIGGTAATGVSLIGAPGSGTSIYLNDISVTNQGTAVLSTFVGFGTASTLGTSNVIAGLMAANGGGIEKPYPTAVGGHITNLALLGSIAAVGTVNVNLSYWIE